MRDVPVEKGQCRDRELSARTGAVEERVELMQPRELLTEHMKDIVR